MTLPPDLNVYISAIMFFLGAYIFALYLGMIVWTVRDIRARSRDVLAQILATVLVAVFTLPGLLVYFLLRPHTTLAEEYERSLTEEAILQELEERRVCPGCRRRVEPDFVVCPHCHHQLRLRCVGCGRLLNPTWDVCPYCGRLREAEAEQEDQSAADALSSAPPADDGDHVDVVVPELPILAPDQHEAEPEEDEVQPTITSAWTPSDWRPTKPLSSQSEAQVQEE